jgi:hypothetical protein
LVQACASTYITNDGVDAAEAGAKDARPDRGSDVKDAGVRPDARDAAGPDGRGEAGACTAVPVGVIPSHGGGACPSDSGSCSPGDLTTFGPSRVPALAGTPHSAACTTAQITDLFDACASSTGSGAACATFQSSYANCYACVLTPIGGASYGPILSVGGFGEVNVGTCIALAEPCNQDCGYAVLAELECQFQACNPGGSCASPTADLACFSAALTCGCSPFAFVASACTKELQAAPTEHPAASVCIGNSTETFADNFVRIANYFCGP